jgi:branched-chain amino acid transport system ATP-binding protein
LLAIRNLSVHHGQAIALDDVSLEVQQGEFVALIGPNGAGKTTLLNTISGLLRASEGTLTFEGQVLNQMAGHRIAGLGIAHCPENRHLAPEMTVLENLRLGAYLRRDGAAVRRTLEWVYDLFPRLRERRSQLVGTLSGGELQMLAIGRSLMSDPRLLMLDEPSLGLAPVIKHRIFRVLKQINDGGLTILLVEQDVRLALKLAGRAYVLETGKIVRHGPSAKLLAAENLMQAFFGIATERAPT